MRSGENLCYFFGDQESDLRNYNSKDFPVDLLFDFKASRLHENYIKIVKDNEKIDNITREVNNTFCMNDNFNVTIVTTVQDPEILKVLLESIPHQKFHKFVIE